MDKTVYLLLENGQYLEGKSFGAPLGAEGVTGEVVFTTGMTGYLETITDPSYYGQIVVQTFPLIGNYGVIPSDFESEKPHLSAYIVKEWCRTPSNFRSEGDLDTFFKSRNVPAVYGIDTRYLIKLLREQGTMNGLLTYEKPTPETMLTALQRKIKSFRVREAVAHASKGRYKEYPLTGAQYRVALWDFGAKENIVRELRKRGCWVTVLPYAVTADEIKRMQVDGLMLSNGPGDPQENTGIISELRKLCESSDLPMFGICLGHQLLALAHGAKTSKLRYGHRGANQPVKELATDRIYMTSQNHGYAVKASSLPEEAKESFINLNDGTCEGVEYLDHPAFSVQFHPEASAGPLDIGFLFDRFIAMMKASQNGGNDHAAE